MSSLEDETPEFLARFSKREQLIEKIVSLEDKQYTDLHMISDHLLHAITIHQDKTLVDLSVARLGPIGAEMKKLTADPVYIDSVLADGSERAGKIARTNMNAVKDILGFVRR